MSGAHDQADRLSVEVLIYQRATATLLRESPEHHVEVTHQERWHEDVVGADHDADGDSGALFLQKRDRIGKDAGGGREQRSDRHLAAVASTQVLELFGRVAQLRQHDLCVPRENLPIWGRLETPIAALEERHVERGLDVLQRLGDRRLAEIEATRGLEDAAAVIDLSD